MDKTVNFTLFKSTGTPVLDENRFECEWDDLATALTEHQILDNKEDAKLISPVSFLKFKDGIRFNDYDGVKYLKRCRDNIDKWWLLPVDIDGEMTIREAKEKFKEFEYVLYTSYRHGTDGVEKFRLFLPLLEPVTQDILLDRIDDIHKWLTGADGTTLSRTRQFYLPSTSNELWKKRYTYTNKGKFLDITQFKLNKKDLVAELARKFKPKIEIDDKFKQVVIQTLKQIRDVDYDIWWKIGCALQDGGVGYTDFDMLSDNLRSHRPDRDSASQWESCRGGDVSFGYIVNLLKEQLGNNCFSKEYQNKIQNKKDDIILKNQGFQAVIKEKLKNNNG